MKQFARATTEAIVAYRAWCVEEDGSLYAVFSGYRWPERSPAEGFLDDGDDRRQASGLYAWRAPQYAWDHLTEIDQECPYLHLVAGAVAIWGEVARHELGYRATRAYPQVLWSGFCPETNRRSRVAANRYGIEFSLPPPAHNTQL